LACIRGAGAAAATAAVSVLVAAASELGVLMAAGGVRGGGEMNERAWVDCRVRAAHGARN
jgi:hypothetical protein